jgi:uncharacterized protein (DUF924 family)
LRPVIWCARDPPNGANIRKVGAIDVIRFWFEEAKPKDWFGKNVDFDEQIRARFCPTHEAAGRCELSSWRSTPEGRLAEIIVLDQFSRNLYRGSARAFACDPLALALAQEAVRAGADREVELTKRSFFYMPYMHSESLLIHDEAARLLDQPGLNENLKYESMHRRVIERFGRYPHRNAALGRTSTQDERDFLGEPDSSF